ncbi:MAG: YceD family protein [Beijerinckiaceae bacterium]
MSKGQDRGRTAGGAGHPGEPPFSRSFTIEELLRRPEEPLVITADAEELAALAKADGLPSIGSMSAEFRVARQGKEIRVTGEVRARVTQECVVTLEPFESEITEPVDVRFAFAPAPVAPEPRSGQRMSRRRAAANLPERRGPPQPDFASHEEDDPPDPIVDGKIDLGALAAEFMALGLDPYPRKPGAEFEPIEDEGPANESPFARLARLRKDQ